MIDTTNIRNSNMLIDVNYTITQRWRLTWTRLLFGLALGIGTTACCAEGIDKTSSELLLTVSVHENPLMAIATLSLPTSGRVYIEYYSADTAKRQTATSDASIEHQLTVVGLRENTTYQFMAIADLDDGGTLQSDVVSFNSGNIIIETPSITLKLNEDESLGGITLFGVLDTYWGVDEGGQIVWYYPTSGFAGTAIIRKLERGEFAGNLLVFLRDELRVIDAAGETLASYDLSAANGYHHDARILNNGNILTISRETASPNGVLLQGDLLTELNAEGDVVWQWSTIEHLDTTRFPGGVINDDDGAFDWSHCNAVVYLEQEKAILLSCRGQNWLIKIDHQSGDIIWILGDDNEIAADFQADFFTLESGAWFTGQHAPVISDDSRLMVFDNRNQSGGPRNNSRAVGYILDQGNLTATQEWEYISPKYSIALGDVDPLNNGHVLVVSGGPSGNGNMVDSDARIIEINAGDSPQAVWDISIENQEVYRAERLSWQDFLSANAAAVTCDFKLSNGRIYTFDENDSVVGSITLLGNKILAVGAMAEATTGCSHEIDLQGRVVIPGLNDAHVHFFDRINAGGHVVSEIDTARTQQQVLDQLNAAIEIQNVPPVSGEVTVRNFLVTEGGNFAAQLAEGAWPNLASLNTVPRPVFLVEGADRGGWVNQVAKDFFDLAGIGNVQADGEVLDVVGAKNYLASLETDDDKQQDWLDGNRWAASVGLTAMQNFLGEPLNNNPEIVALYEQGIAFLRFHFAVNNSSNFLATPASTTPDTLRLTSIGEFHAGSSFSGPGANYLDDALEMASSGITTHQHALRTQSDIEAYLSLWEAAAEIDDTIHDLRWRLDHVFDISSDQMNRLGALGGNLSVHGIGGGGSASAQNLQQTIDSGLNVSAGSDGGNFYAINPWVSIHYFVTGRGQTGVQVMNPEFTVSLYQAIKMYTIGSAFDTFDEAIMGSLEVGKLADFSVLSDDPFAIESSGDIDEIINMHSVLTLVDGDIVYSDGLVACNGSMDSWARNLTSPFCELRDSVADSISGSWYNPEQAGHGFVLQVLALDSGSQLLAYWFVWRDGLPVWVFGLGSLEGNMAGMTLYINSGADFPPNFNAEDIVSEEWGTALFEFESDSTAMVTWESSYFNDGSLSLQRLTRIATASGGVADAVSCLSGAWLNPSEDGHGLLFEVVELSDTTQLVLYWFTFVDGDPTWIIGQAPLLDGRVSMTALLLSGGEFPPAFDPNTVSVNEWGSIEIEFTDSSTAQILWQSDLSQFSSGSATLIRLTELAGHPCSEGSVGF